MRFMRLIGIALLVGLTTLGSTPGANWDDPVPHGQDAPPGPPLSPEQAVAKMTVPKGFHVEIVAAEPQIVNPTAMTFDERGRIWIAESVEYPRQSAGEGKDRIKILEDVDGDGKADKSTVFAEGLNIPSGIAVGYGGVWVANSPDVLFLTDENGDGKADKREVVVTGFGRFDTHELPNSLTWGPDGWLYGWNGVFNNSHIEYRGKTYDFTCALFRIHPRTRDFEVFAEGTSNPWGVAFNREGAAFASACVIDHLWHLTETGHYIRQGGPDKPYAWPLGSIVDHKHQKRAYCGILYFDSDAYPAEYSKSLYMGNIHGNCINVDYLSRNGSTYVGNAKPDFLAANDSWFMPVSQKIGPDGCLYILDWYDRYHCYQDAGRDPEGIDRLKGRLYRVRYGDPPRLSRVDLGKESSQKLVERLASPNLYFRDQAQRLLGERNDAEANARMKNIILSDASPKRQRMHAIWSLAGAGAIDDSFLLRLLSEKDPSIRSWGVRLAGNKKAVGAVVRSRIAELALDQSADVRLQVAIASRKIDGADAMKMLVGVLSASDEDELIPHIVWQNLHPLLEQEGTKFVNLLEGVELSSSPGFKPLFPLIAKCLLAAGESGRKSFVALVKRLAVHNDHQWQSAAACLSELLAALNSGQIPAADLASMRSELNPALEHVIAEEDLDVLVWSAWRVKAAWDDPKAIDEVATILENPDEPEETRIEAVQALVGKPDPRVLAAVGKILREPRDSSSEFRGRLISELAKRSDEAVAKITIQAYPTLEPELKPRVVELLTDRASWSKQLIDAVSKNAIPSSALNVNQVRKMLRFKDAELVKRVGATWGSIREERNPKREEAIDRIRDLIADTPGDPYAGALAFKKVCAQCHMIHGEGQEVGPDLTGNGRNSYDQLVSNVLDPSLVIGAAYQAVLVSTKDGRVLTGLLAEDSPERIVLKVQGGKRETIAKNEIEERSTSPLSLMPEDLEKQLSEQEIVDLFSFLCLDKPPTDPSAQSRGLGPFEGETWQETVKRSPPPELGTATSPN